MPYPDGYTTAGTFDTGGAGVPLGEDHRTTHEALPGWINAMEAHAGPHPTTTAQSLVYYATRNAQRNWADNGNFDISQSGDGPFTTTNVVGIDRHPDVASGSTFSTTRVALAPSALLEGAYIHPARYHKRVTVTTAAGAGNFCYSLHRIYGVHYLAGQNATFAIWMKADAAKTVAFSASQNFGTGGAPSVTVTGIGASKANITTAWTRLTFYVSIPSIVGKTMGTSGTDCLELKIWYDAGSTFAAETNTLGQRSGTFDSTLWNLRKGWLIGDYEEVAESQMLTRCQRWRHVSSALQGPMGQAYDANMVSIAYEHPGRMAVAPALSAPAGPYTNMLERAGIALATPTAIALYTSNVDRAVIRVTATGLVTQFSQYLLNTVPLTFFSE